jgi:hypothetical protein
VVMSADGQPLAAVLEAYLIVFNAGNQPEMI